MKIHIEHKPKKEKANRQKKVKTIHLGNSQKECPFLVAVIDW